MDNSMESNRLKVQKILEGLIENDNVYFQPPESISVDYPVIFYSRNDIRNNYANDSQYSRTISYKITVIDRIPDSKIVDKVSTLIKCSYDTNYISDNLYHDVFILNY